MLLCSIYFSGAKNGGQNQGSERPLRSGIGHCVCFHSNGHLVLSVSVNISVGEGEHDDEGRDNGLYCKWFSIWNKTRFFRPSPFLMHSGQKSPKLDHLLQRTFKKVVYYTVSKNGDFSDIAQWTKINKNGSFSESISKDF